MTAAEIVQIVIGLLSLVATVAVSFFIYWLQRRHEKEMARLENKQKQEQLIEDAHKFLIDNADDVDYLPWCVIAANQHRHAHHERNIYTNFCRCSKELQNLILEIAGFTLRTIDGTSWVEEGFKKLESDIERYHLGEQPFLYDDAKYFHRSFDRYREIEYKTPRHKPFKTIYKQSPLFVWDKNEVGKVSLMSYVQQYFDYVLDTEKKLTGLEWEDPIPPVDYVWDGCELCNIDEDVVCLWVMELVGNFIINIHNRDDSIDPDNMLFNNSTDGQAETYEDRYYEILERLYFTYCYNSNQEEKNKKKRNKKVKVKDHNKAVAKKSKTQKEKKVEKK